MIDLYNIRYTPENELDRKLFQFLNLGDMKKFWAPPVVQAPKKKSNFKQRKSIRILFGDKSAAKVIFE